MRGGAALALLAAACAEELPLGDEIQVVRADPEGVEPPPSAEAPLWSPEFNQLVQDDTTDVPPKVYTHLLFQLSRRKEAEIEESVLTGVKARDLTSRPAQYRGKIVRIVGRISRIWIVPLSSRRFPESQAYGGLLYVNDVEPVLFHSLGRPVSEPLYIKEDVVGIDGIFVQVIAHELAGGGVLRAPFLVARSIRKYH